MPLELTEKQAYAWLRILDAPTKRRILFDGGARCGKTVLICAWLAYQTERYPAARVLAARKHRNAAAKSLYNETFKQILTGRPEFRFYDGEMEIRNLRTGGAIYVDGLDDQERVDKVLGREFSHIFFNEASQLTWSTVTTVLSRLAQPAVPVRKAIFDCNPKGQRHWLYRAGVMGQDPETGDPLTDADAWARLHWTPYDNPHLPADYMASLEALSGTQRRRMLGGEWCDAEGQVYDEFDEDIHVIDEMPTGWQSWRRCRAIDFGFTNPFVCLWGAVDPDGRLYIYRERYRPRIIVADHAAAIRAFPEACEWTIADHDAEDRATLAAEGIETERADKRVLPGIEAVKARLRSVGDGRPRLYILRDCRETIAEFLDYAWAPFAEGRADKEAPIKDRDHALDALRYMVMKLDHEFDHWGPSGTLRTPGH
jgi:phage terminase large subunit